MIVTAKPPRRRRQEQPKAAIACPVIVTARKPGARPYASPSANAEPDPEAEERARAWLMAQLRPAT